MPLCSRKSNTETEIISERERGEKKLLVAHSAFPHRVFSKRVCVLLAREDVDSGTAPIRIKANGIRGQRHALWVEIALPLLRENTEKPPHWPFKTINVDKCQ